MNTLTTKDDWDRNYSNRQSISELSFGWRDRVNSLIAKKIEDIRLLNKYILEIGAGDSQWLLYLAKKYPKSRFVGLDYSKTGCERLSKRKAAAGATNIEIYNQDMFCVDTELHGKFDLVMSFGVVEHFNDLSVALLAKRKYLNSNGVMFSLIPNMTGSIGYLTKFFNRAVYDIHNPHDLDSFIKGHHDANLQVISAGYLGSVNYGVLSGCFEKTGGFKWHIYLFLTRLSKAIAFLESNIGDLPSSKIFSPYIYVISRSS